MPAWDNFKNKYQMEVEDLLNPAGFNVVVIERIDSEQYEEKKTRAVKFRHNLYLAGFECPLRLNNTRIDVLKSMFGPLTEDAVGKKIALLAAASSSYGDTEISIHIHPVAPPTTAPLTDVRADVACKQEIRRRTAEMYGVRILPPPAALFAGGGGGNQPWTHQQPAGALPAPASPAAAPAPASEPLGMQSAAKLLVMLRERGRDWDFVLQHLRTCGMSHLAEGKSPPECDTAIKAPVWAVLKDLPVTKPVEDRAKAEADLIAAWTPPAPTTTTVLGLDGKPLPVTDDIPF